MKQKKRLDLLLLERYPQLSRTYLQSMIMQGNVLVDGQVQTKSGALIAPDAVLELKQEEPKYVSRAGLKLEKALQHFNLDVSGYVALDAGLSTGGFADCLLQHGAKKVYGVDVGYGQVHEKLRIDPRVVIMERTNLRYLPELPEKVDIVTLDLSFISVLKVIEIVKRVLKPGGRLIVLIKPQFEARREQVGAGGIIRDLKVHQETIERVVSSVVQEGFENKGVVESPITGADGNKEFLAAFVLEH